jgi:hypothetical protein
MTAKTSTGGVNRTGTKPKNGKRAKKILVSLRHVVHGAESRQYAATLVQSVES